MATWSTDVRGTNFARHEPTPAELKVARLIAGRWAKWSPILLLELRRHPQPAGYVAKEMLRLEYVHAARMRRLFEHYSYTRDISKLISHRTYRLDDPRLPEAEFAARLKRNAHQHRCLAARKKERERHAKP